MQMLNKAKAFGKIAGDLFIPDGADRPANYEQDGKFFDAHGRLIEAGVPVSIVPTEDLDDGVAVEEDDLPMMTVADLLQQADTMRWPVFRKMAQKALGPECPPTKAAIMDHLQKVQQEFDSRAAKRAAERRQPPPTSSNSTIDLAAWGRGQKEYLWAEVRKAIKSEFGRNVGERDDAVEFLISQQVITTAEARRDVIRQAT